MTRPRVPWEGQRRTVLHPLEYAALLTAARRDGPASHALVALLGMIGPRISEATNINIADLRSRSGYELLTILGAPAHPARIIRSSTALCSWGSSEDLAEQLAEVARELERGAHGRRTRRRHSRGRPTSRECRPAVGVPPGRGTATRATSSPHSVTPTSDDAAHRTAPVGLRRRGPVRAAASCVGCLPRLRHRRRHPCAPRFRSPAPG